MVLERMGSASAIPPPHASVRQDSLNKQPLGAGVYQSMRKSPSRRECPAYYFGNILVA